MSKDYNVSITPTTSEYEVGGGYGAITTSGSSEAWTAAVSDDWIVLKSTTGTVGKGCAYTVTASTNVETRTGYVYVSGHVHTVKQAGWGATISSKNAEVECDGGTGTIDVTVGGKYGWNARPNVDWLSVTPTHGVGNGEVKIQIAPWHEVSTRSGTVTIAGNTFTVFQYGKRMKLSSYKETRNYETHVIPITVDALAITKWNVTPNASWISIADAGSGQGGDEVGVVIAENPSYKARTGTVTIGTETLTITQEGRTALSFAIDPETTTADVGGANGLIAVTATPDLPWTSASAADWLTIYPKFKTGAGNGNVVYTASPNPTLYDRTGTITITPEAASGVAAKTHTVMQPAAVSSISLTGYEFEAAGENCAVEVTVDEIVEWKVEGATNGWLTVVGDTARVGPATITLQAAENTTVYPRTCTLTIARKTFSVTQKGRGVTVDTDSFVFGTKSQGSSFTVKPDGNVSWMPVSSDDSWLILLDDSTRTGNGEVKFVLTQYNGTGAARTGTITVGDKVVYVTQRAFDLSINPTGAWVTGNAGAGEIGVSADLGAVWNAIVTEPWIKVISGYDSGTGSGTVRYTYEDNNTGKTRSGKIVISGTAYTIERAARVMVSVKTEAGNGGSVAGGGSYSLGTEVTLTAMPADGYQFAYWEGDVSSMQNPITVTADVAKSVKAVFTPLTPEFISVSNASDGVTLVWTNLAWATEYNIYRAPTSSRTGSPLATLVADGTHSYFDATGDVGVPYWYWVEAVGAVDTNECVNPVSGKKLKPIVISNITYENLRGTTHTNPVTYQEETVVAFTPPSGTVTGYTFAGWTPNGITAEMTGDQTVTANWTANSYEVQFHANGGSGTMANQALTYDVEQTLTACAFVRDGYEFVGWGVGGEDAAEMIAGGAVVSNLTATAGDVVELWAVWKLKEVSAPVIKPADGSSFKSDSCTVIITSATEGATIYYSVNGRTPTVAEKYRYAGSFIISETSEITAFAYKDGIFSDYVDATITRVEAEQWTLKGVLDEVKIGDAVSDCNAAWTPTDDPTAVGGSCAVSGVVEDADEIGDESAIRVTIRGTGRLSFSWRTDCEPDPRAGKYTYDHAEFWVDDETKPRALIDGKTEWTNFETEITTEGEHTLVWKYVSDGYLPEEGEYESCAWLDNVGWSGLAFVSDPIPDLNEPTPEEVKKVMAQAEDQKLVDNITNATDYAAFREWSGKVKKQDADEAVSAAEIMSATNAWLSYALDSARLILSLPVDGDLKVDTFESADNGKFAFTVSVKEISVGTGATSDNLKKVFGLEGGMSLGELSSDNVDLTFETPVDGKVKFTAGPNAKNADAATFFMKVKMNP